MPQAKTPLINQIQPQNIPPELKAQQRWAPWRAVWNEKRGKYDKIPCYPNGMGLSTAKPEKWMSFDVALRAFEGNPNHFAGIGYVMTGPHDMIGTDLDNCIHDGQIDDWALQIIARLNSYAELSPSGNGVRAFNTGATDVDWNNHEVGIEVYSGHEPRFLTVTGVKLPIAPATVSRADPELMASIASKYAPDRKSKAMVIDLSMPELVDYDSIDLSSIELPYKVRDFLASGKVDGDRSRMVHATGIALYTAGLSDGEVLTVLTCNQYTMEVALDHRRQDADRATMYLWVEHCQKAKPKTSAAATLDQFEDLSANDAPTQTSTPSPTSPAPKRGRFEFQHIDELLNVPPMRWLIKGIVPHATVGAIYGESKAGKSFFTIDLAMAIARGEPWQGRRTTQATVAYLVAEGFSGFPGRVAAYCQHNGLDREHLPFYYLDAAPNFLEVTDIKDLTTGLKKLQNLKLIIVDTLAQVTAGANENSSEDMGRAIKHANHLSKVTGAMVILVAHSGKDSSRGIRGWSGILGALDMEICVERSGEHRSATMTKVKDANTEGMEFGFKLNVKELGRDLDNDPITSAVVTFQDRTERVANLPPLENEHEKIVFNKLVELQDIDGMPVPEETLLEAAKKGIPRKGKVDNRKRDAARAVLKLVSNKYLLLDEGLLRVADGASQVTE